MVSLLTYARAAAPLVPLASRLPFVAGGGGEMPELERVRENVTIDRERLAAYAEVCGFPARDALPATYPHVLAFDLHMELMTDGRFPFPAIGLVHIANTIEQRRPIGAGERLDLRAYPTAIEPHARGQAFSIITETRVADELVWKGHSTMLRRRGDGAKSREHSNTDSAPGEEWRLEADLGRRYAGVSGDRNPIHMSDLTAKAFGFPRAIAHGMWTKARCLAALEAELPEAFTVEVEFRRPILLPASVTFEGDLTRFSVRDADEGTPHLEGTVS
jgi:hypothetical protein